MRASQKCRGMSTLFLRCPDEGWTLTCSGTRLLPNITESSRCRAPTPLQHTWPFFFFALAAIVVVIFESLLMVEMALIMLEVWVGTVVAAQRSPTRGISYDAAVLSPSNYHPIGINAKRLTVNKKVQHLFCIVLAVYPLESLLQSSIAYLRSLHLVSNSRCNV